MSTDMTWQISTKNLEETEKLGKQIGARLRGGEVIELIADLGGGKTSFTRGLAEGLGSTDHVASPTFTLSRQYQAGKLRMVHYDFYRLHDPGILEFELTESVNDPNAITVVEWADIVQDVLPKRRLTIHIKITADTERDFIVTNPTTLGYIVPEKARN